MSIRELVVGHVFLRVLRHFVWLRRTPLAGRLLQSLSRAILPPHSRLWVRVRNGPAIGLWINVNPRTGDDLYRGKRESLVQEALSEHLRCGMVLYDVGANLGLFTLIGARKVGNAGKVYAFEPDPEVCQRLRKNVRRNGFSNVEVIEAAVWSRTGSLQFLRADPAISPDLGLGKTCLGSNESTTIQVPGVSLDGLEGKALPDVIKCDVEGAEMEVLEGARSIIDNKRPTVICEVHSRALGIMVERFFRERRYTVRWLGTSHMVMVPSMS